MMTTVRAVSEVRRPPRCAVEVSATAAVPIGAVWECLADAASFAVWVCGTRTVSDADEAWPAVGASLYHRWGRWPLQVADRTTVTACRPPHRLDLDARVRRLARVAVWIRLTEVAGGTRVVLGESIDGGLATAVPPLTRRIQRWRNRRSLAALIDLASRRPRPGPPLHRWPA